MYFFIKKGATLPHLRIEVVEVGSQDYRKLYECLEGADITFSMYNVDSGMYKVSNAPCIIKRYGNENCSEQYAICYEWKERDTKVPGTYIGQFDIKMSEHLASDKYSYPTGTLTVPIREPLNIIIEE